MLRHVVQVDRESFRGRIDLQQRICSEYWELRLLNGGLCVQKFYFPVQPCASYVWAIREHLQQSLDLKMLSLLRNMLCLCVNFLMR